MMTVPGTQRAGTACSHPLHSARPALVQQGVAVAGSQVMKGMMLVVDDDEGVRAVMASVLEDEGGEGATATNGWSALETLQRTRPGVISLDLRMPVMDGLTFADRYREFPEPRAPLILITHFLRVWEVMAVPAVHVTSQQRDGRLPPRECRPDLKKLRACIRFFA